MTRIILAIVGVSALLLALGIDASVLIRFAVVSLILGCGFSYIFRGKPLKDFWWMVAALLIGPCILIALSRVLIGNLQANVGSTISSPLLTVALLIALIISSIYVRARILSHRKASERASQTNERQPLMPPADQDPPSGESES